MAFYRNFNAAVDFGGRNVQVVDLSVDNYDPQTKISDQRAAAQHYNNRTVEYLNRDNTAEAYRHLRRALYPARGISWTIWVRDLVATVT